MAYDFNGTRALNDAEKELQHKRHNEELVAHLKHRLSFLYNGKIPNCVLSAMDSSELSKYK
jgi:hypothetical protein